MIIKLLITLYFLSNAFSNEDPYILVLGIAQDGGYPHTGCYEDCCVNAWEDKGERRFVSSLALLIGNDCYIFDITPD